MGRVAKRTIGAAVSAAALVILSCSQAPTLDAPKVPKILDAGPVDFQEARDTQAEFRAAQTEFQDYLRRARILKRYHDSGKLYDSDVFRALGQAGSAPAAKWEFKPSRASPHEERWRWPLRAGVISSEFGPRWGRAHEGIDIAANLGSPVYAAAAGKVVYAGHGLRGYGNVVILRHDAKTITLYAHNEALRVRVGEKVERGHVIALLGSTGHSTGPHVHFEIRRDKHPINPRKILPKSRFFLGYHKA